MILTHEYVSELWGTQIRFYDERSDLYKLTRDWLEMHEEIVRLKAELDSLQTTVSASDCVKKPNNCQAEHFKFGKCTNRHGHPGIIHNSGTGVWVVDDGTYCLSMPIAEWLGLLAEAVPDRPQSHRVEICRSTYVGYKCSLSNGHAGDHMCDRGRIWT